MQKSTPTQDCRDLPPPIREILYKLLRLQTFTWNGGSRIPSKLSTSGLVQNSNSQMELESRITEEYHSVNQFAWPPDNACSRSPRLVLSTLLSVVWKAIVWINCSVASRYLRMQIEDALLEDLNMLKPSTDHQTLCQNVTLSFNNRKITEECFSTKMSNA